jgi:N-carbamoyl-L-amino-acid hydrolase
MIGINSDRLRCRFDTMAKIGATLRGGMHRLALSHEDKVARDLLASWCRDCGFELTVDRIGNMFATRPGLNPDLPPLLIGSHLDSQPYAGAYDGPVGVLAALEVLEALDENAIPTNMPIQLVNWSNEEGARFRPPLLASGVFAGVHDLDFALSVQDSKGLSFREELANIGYDGKRKPGWPISGYIEIHIEQGTVLEDAGIPIGIVTGVVGIADIKVIVQGEDAHAGPLPMSKRRDSLVGAAEMILTAREIGCRQAPEARVTVGRISVPSDSHSVVPGRTEFVLDLRHPDDVGLAALEAEAKAAFSAIAAKHQLSVAYESVWAYPPTLFDERLQKEIARAARELGHSHLRLPSRAGHDAWNLARVGPSAMIFIPCRGGISHNELEFAEFEHIAAAANVLLLTVIAWSNGDLRLQSSEIA